MENDNCCNLVVWNTVVVDEDIGVGFDWGMVDSHKVVSVVAALPSVVEGTVGIEVVVEIGAFADDEVGLDTFVGGLICVGWMGPFFY